MKNHKTILFHAFMLAFIVVSIEGAAYLFLIVRQISYRDVREFNRNWEATSSRGYYAHYENEYPYLPYRVRPGRNEDNYSNQKGYRGRSFTWTKSPDVYRIACLGGSTTWEGTYPRALEDSLNEIGRYPIESFEVLNFGAESWTSVEILINFSVRGIHANPDAIVVYEAINDVIAGSYPAGIVPEPDYSHWRSRLRSPPRSFMNYVPISLDSFRAIGSTRYFFYKIMTADAWRMAMRNYGFSCDQTFQGVTTFGLNIRNIVAVALANDIRVFLVTQAHSPELSRKVCEDGSVIHSVHQVNDVTRDIAKEFAPSGKVHLIDVEAKAAELGLIGEMTDWCHFTKTGYRNLGDYIAEEITGQLTRTDNTIPGN